MGPPYTRFQFNLRNSFKQDDKKEKKIENKEGRWRRIDSVEITD